MTYLLSNKMLIKIIKLIQLSSGVLRRDAILS